MKKFHFALEPVLRHRQRVEDDRAQQLAQRMRQLEDAEGDLRRLDQEFGECAGALRANHRSFETEELRHYCAHLEYLDRAITAQIRVVAERRVAVDRARQTLISAAKDRKVVDALRERRHGEYVAEELRTEQNELDDGNSRRYVPVQPASGGTP